MKRILLVLCCMSNILTANNAVIQHIQQARTYTQNNEYEQAIYHYKQAYALRPSNIGILTELASTMAQTDRVQEALRLHHKLRAYLPSNSTILFNSAYLFKKLGNMRDAQLLYRKVLQKRPDYAQAHVGIAQAHLALGNFIEGWQSLDWQFYPRIVSGHALRDYLATHRDLTGKTIVIREDWSCGDTIQFLRFVKELKSYGARVLFHARKRNKCLRTLIKQQPYVDAYIEHDQPTPAHDFLTSSIGLPMVLRTTVDTLPSAPYLSIDPSITRYWRNYMRPFANSIKIGICWHGDPTNALSRCMPLELLVQLADIPNVQLFSLQKFDGIDQLDHLPNKNIVHVFDDSFDITNGSFIDTAAVMQSLDVVVTIDTSVAHLAGALGVPTFVALQHIPDWRWMLEKETSPWYRNTRLFRQPTPGDWQSVINAINQEIRCLEN